MTTVGFNKMRVRELGAAALRVANQLESGALKLSRLGRSYVFRDNGSTCCIFGHVIAAAGLKREMAPFKGPDFSGATGARWWSSWEAFKALTGYKGLGTDARHDPMGCIIDDLVVANDTLNGDARRARVAGLLRNFASGCARLTP